MPTSVEADSTIQRDQDGNIRLSVVGNSGTGKSTTADELGRILSAPVLHLDQLHWMPDWNKAPRAELREKVELFMGENDNWIIDGNYKNITGDLVQQNATNIIWLDPPFILYFPRVIRRTFLRLFGLIPPCSPGCNEKLSDIFTLGEKSIIWWTWSYHTRTREYYSRAMRDDGGKIIRVGGWGSEKRDLLRRVEYLAKIM